MIDRAERLEALLPKLLRRMFSDVDHNELSELSIAQMRILRAVLEGPHTAGEIVEQLGYSPSALSQITQRLVCAGLITKTKDPDDARIKHLDLTEKARALMEQRRAIRVQQADFVLSRLAEEEQSEFIRLLEKMSRSAGKESWMASIERLTA